MLKGRGNERPSFEDVDEKGMNMEGVSWEEIHNPKLASLPGRVDTPSIKRRFDDHFETDDPWPEVLPASVDSQPEHALRRIIGMLSKQSMGSKSHSKYTEALFTKIKTNPL